MTRILPGRGANAAPPAEADQSRYGAFGAALIAGVGAGVYADLAQAGKASVTIEKTFLPNAATLAYYDRMYDLYKESYQSLQGVNQGFYRMLEENDSSQ